MLVRSIKDKAFSSLSEDAKLHINLESSTTAEEKLMHYIDYATNIAQRRSLSETNKPERHSNLEIIMCEIEFLLDLRTIHRDTLSAALFHAITCPELVRLLLMKGASPDFQNAFGNTPLHHAASNWFTFYQKNLLLSAELLASTGADTDIKNNRDKCAIELIDEMVNLRPQENRIQFKADFERVTETPRPLYAIKTPVTERNPAPLMLSEKDSMDIQLYREALQMGFCGSGFFTHSRKMDFNHKGGRTLTIYSWGVIYRDTDTPEPEYISMLDNNRNVNMGYSFDVD